MKSDDEMIRADSPAERLMLWSKALRLLADEGVASQLVSALEAGASVSMDSTVMSDQLPAAGGSMGSTAQ